ncbi:beta-lactamase family protein [Halomonas sp. Y3S6]|uniref:Beta-lactamase family protein n=1 Tax=Billgrantia antri TaxID=2846777 RepID=A0ABS6ZT65_9GAMM|nr:beta-lactamase family protein [Halomonas antri]
MEFDGTFTLEGEEVSLEAFLEGTRTNALLVLKDGKIAYERYRNGLDEATPHAVFSVSKSILATLIGFAVEDGSIASLDDKVVDYVPAMAGSGYEDVSILEVLRMRSGVAWEEVYEFGAAPSLPRYMTTPWSLTATAGVTMRPPPPSASTSPAKGSTTPPSIPAYSAACWQVPSIRRWPTT